MRWTKYVPVVDENELIRKVNVRRKGKVSNDNRRHYDNSNMTRNALLERVLITIKRRERTEVSERRKMISSYCSRGKGRSHWRRYSA